MAISTYIVPDTYRATSSWGNPMPLYCQPVFPGTDSRQQPDGHFLCKKNKILSLIFTFYPSFIETYKPLPSVGTSDQDGFLLDTSLYPRQPKLTKRKRNLRNWMMYKASMMLWLYLNRHFVMTRKVLWKICWVISIDIHDDLAVFESTFCEDTHRGRYVKLV